METVFMSKVIQEIAWSGKPVYVTTKQIMPANEFEQAMKELEQIKETKQ